MPKKNAVLLAGLRTSRKQLVAHWNTISDLILDGIVNRESATNLRRLKALRRDVENSLFALDAFIAELNNG